MSFQPGTLLRRLHEAGVEYIVLGGFAAIAHGVQRATADIDICPEPGSENLQRLAALLVDIDARPAEGEGLESGEFTVDPTDPAQLGQGENFRLETRLGNLDVMQWIAGLGDDSYGTLSSDAISATVLDTPVRVCSREALITMKKAADRPIDRADLDQLGS